MKKTLSTLSILLIFNVLSFAQTNFPYRYGAYATVGWAGYDEKVYTLGFQYKLMKTKNLWLRSNYMRLSGPNNFFDKTDTKVKNDSTITEFSTNHYAQKYRLNLGFEQIRSINKKGSFQWSYGVDFGFNIFKLTPKTTELDVVTTIKTFGSGTSVFSFPSTDFFYQGTTEGTPFTKAFFTLSPHIGLGYRISKGFWLRSELSVALLIAKKQGDWRQTAEDISFNPIILQYYFGENKSK